VKFLDECRFSAVSEYHVATCSPRLQLVLRRAIRCAPRYLDFAVICGHRNQLDQEEAYKKGASKVRWPNSKHNTFPSSAADIRPAPFVQADWKDTVRFGRVIGFIEAVSCEVGVPLRVGLDWDMDGKTIDEAFQDLGHLEEAA
jgi:peptidoglycan L-alanyl-D-glutamate endopeptidase CwlK